MTCAAESGGSWLRCAACGQVNPAGARFCNGCGSLLSEAQPCPRCGKPSAADESVCPRCGGVLERQSPSTSQEASGAGRTLPVHPAESAGRLSSELLGERKHVTVLFADVK